MRKSYMQKVQVTYSINIRDPDFQLVNHKCHGISLQQLCLPVYGHCDRKLYAFQSMYKIHTKV